MFICDSFDEKWGIQFGGIEEMRETGVAILVLSRGYYRISHHPIIAISALNLG
jgi:hypothetical protein